MNIISKYIPSKNSILVKSPGRINIIGEHTDYNGGFVLPAAIDKCCVFQLSRNGTASEVNIKAASIDEHLAFDLLNFKPIKDGWENYVMGVVSELQKLGADLKGFDAVFEGNVPIGSGMSSSAALECSLAFGLNELFQLGFDQWQLIKASQMAEHHFVGTKCGIMDQFASMMGKKDQVMLLDCRSLDFEYFPLELGKYQLLLLNTNVSHSLATSGYNDRRSECEEGVRILNEKYKGIELLRDVKPDQLEESKALLSNTVFKRCKHIVTENERVLSATKAMMNKDFMTLGKLIYASHESLSKDYEVSCPELDFLVELTKDKDYILGSRMMGGGFGGCTINLIEKEWVTEFVNLARTAYYGAFGINLSDYEVLIEEGAGIV